MGTVRRSERVVDVEIEAVDQTSREVGIVALLTRVEAQVLDQLDAGSQLGEAGANRRHRELRCRLALRPAEVAGTHDLAAT